MTTPAPEGILLVEDHPDTSAALRHLLTAKGYSVITAEDGQQALDLLEAGARPRLILIDLMLPHVSGWDLLAYLQRDPDLRHTPTIVITGVPKPQVHVVADAVFSKPLDFSALTTKVDQLVTRDRVP
jgi:CheY-like chemotaxis protein